MKPFLSALLFGLSLSTATTAPATAYPVDCALLLCLAGGWPASVECAHARVVFIRRITPWPIEPPLQIWNCPMQAASRREPPIERFVDIVSGPPMRPRVSLPVLTRPAAILVTDQADIDISDTAFDFVRSIRVVQTEYRTYRNIDGDCHRPYKVTLGTYGEQGDFRWTNGDLSDIPAASAFAPNPSCSNYLFRSVVVDWTDQVGTYGFEEVLY